MARKIKAKPVAGKTPVTETKPENHGEAVQGFTARYLYPQELVDNPRVWESENFYFGETNTLYMGETETAVKPPWYQSVLQTVVGLYQQKQAIKQTQEQNIQREKAGLPPVSAAEIKRQFAPQASVELGLSPQVRNMLLIAGAGVAALLVFNMMRKRA